jgi:SP family sugar:H+ symporter-like MFS transporter
MGVNIGWIFGSVAAFSVVWGFLFFPELKVSSHTSLSYMSDIGRIDTNQGRSLEEVDELFAAKLWAWQYHKYETHGTGRLLALLENEGVAIEKAKIEEHEFTSAQTNVSYRCKS